MKERIELNEDERYSIYVRTRHRKKLLTIVVSLIVIMTLLVVRIGCIMTVEAEYYSRKATELHERERAIKAMRGRILDTNGVVLADNKTVCTVSVIHNQIKEADKVITMLCDELSADEQTIAKKVNKVSSIEIIKTNVDKEIGDRIREYGYSGVKVDEDYKRYYPYDTLASKVIGFTGSDNQGIVGLEAKYDAYLSGIVERYSHLQMRGEVSLPEKERAGLSRRRVRPVYKYRYEHSVICAAACRKDTC